MGVKFEESICLLKFGNCSTTCKTSLESGRLALRVRIKTVVENC